MLETYIREKRQSKDILLMTHIVIGYPSFEDAYDIVEQMVSAGVDIMELQIPFSEPMADGPVILKANQCALERGATVEKCMAFAQRVAQDFNIPFLFMSYANIPFQYGMERFASQMADMGLKGAIIPDLPPEEHIGYKSAMAKNELSPIYIFSPETDDRRMADIAAVSSGFIYCLARKGVTGKQTDFSQDLATYLSRCKTATDLPLAVGFGVKDREDVEFLKGKADIAVIGSQTIRLVDRNGPGAAGEFIRGLTD